MNHLELQGARLAYLRAGSGVPPLVLVHGFACAHDDWQHQVARFSGERDTVALDLRRHGASSGDAIHCTLEQYGADVAVMLRELALAPAVLVGHSMGCRVVLEAWSRARDRIAGLVLLDGSRLGHQPEDEANMRQLIEFMRYPAFARALFGEALLPPTAPGRAIIERAARLPAEVGLTLFPSMVAWDALRMDDTLASVTVPLMAMQSTYLDPQRKRVHLRPGQSSPWLDLVRQRAPHARIEIVADAGHFTMLDAPEAVNRLLADFIGGLPAGS